MRQIMDYVILIEFMNEEASNYVYSVNAKILTV
jgi:hypothetical protein